MDEPFFPSRNSNTMNVMKCLWSSNNFSIIYFTETLKKIRTITNCQQQFVAHFLETIVSLVNEWKKNAAKKRKVFPQLDVLSICCCSSAQTELRFICFNSIFIWFFPMAFLSCPWKYKFLHSITTNWKRYNIDIFHFGAFVNNRISMVEFWLILLCIRFFFIFFKRSIFFIEFHCYFVEAAFKTLQ